MITTLPSILVIGFTGVGKTSLLQSLFGTELVPDERIAHGAPGTSGFVAYQNNHLRIYDSMGLEPGEKVETKFIDNVETFMAALRDEASTENHIHILWYCLDGTRARVTECDIAIIKKLWRHVIVLITKADITRTDQADSMIRVLESNGLQKDNILQVSAFSSVDLSNLIRRTQELLPKAKRSVLGSCIKNNHIFTHKDHGERVWSVAFSPDGTVLASGGKDNQVVIRNLGPSESTFKINKIPTSNDVNTVQFSPNGQFLSYGDDDGWVYIVSAPFDDLATFSRQKLSNYCYSLAFHPTRPLLAAGTKANAVVLFRYGHSDGRLDLQHEHRYETNNDVNSVAFSHDGNYLYFADDDGILHRALLANREQVETWKLSNQYLRSVDTHPSLDMIVVSGDDRRVRIYSFKGRFQRIASLERKTIVRSARFSPCGEFVIFGDDFGCCGIWDWERDKLLGAVLCESPGTAVLSVAISPDGCRIATGLDNGEVKTWELDK